MPLIKLLTDPGQFTFYKGKGYQYKPREVPYGNDRPGGGTSNDPLVVTPLPSVDSSPTAKTKPDSLYRGQGVLSQAVLDATKRISKFLVTEEGLRFTAKQQALLLKDNIARYGNNVSQYTFYNPLKLVEQTALSGTGVHITGSVVEFLNPKINRVSKFKEQDAGKWKVSNNQEDRVDGITTAPMYQSENVKIGAGYDDSVDLYFTKINNDGSGNNTYIHFRSYIKGFSDSYGADWKSFSYMGRGEDFFKYNGFNRDISFSFEVPVLSSLEQSSVYSKLNYMASCMAPDYTTGGFMRGNLFKLTVGDYITDLPGILTGISFDINDEAGWDIDRSYDGDESKTWVMPKLISVGGFKFKPIHNFIPQTVNSKFITDGSGADVNSPFISFGKNSKDPTSEGGYSNKQTSLSNG